MKRLVLLVSAVVFFVSTFVFFPVSRAVAAEDKAAYDYYQVQINEYFAAADRALDSVYNRDKVAQAQPTEAFKRYFSNLSTAYNTTFNAEFAKGTPAVDAQILAITAFNRARDSGENKKLIVTYSGSAPQNSTLKTLSKNISDADFIAGQIKRNVIAAGSEEAAIGTPDASTIENATAGNKNITTKTSADPSKCSFLSTDFLIDCISAGVQWLIKNTLLEIGGFMVWLTANMFNYAIKIGVLEFASWAPDSLYPIWLIIRQIASLLIVFVGLYLGFMYILGKDEKFEKYIPWVIMFALFVNFSYPLVRTAIDISNIVSLKVYVSVVGPEVLDPVSTKSAGALIMSKLGLQQLAASATADKDGNGIVGSINSVPGALLAVCYVFYTAYIFFMVTALFILRTAALVFLIVASPLLLVDSVLPMLGEKAKLLRKIFFEQLAIGPIFMIMLALTMKFLDVFSASGKLSASGMSNLGGDTSGATIAVFFNMLMMLIMLWIMLKVTKSTAGTLGEYATSAMGTVGGFALGAATGGTGLLARKGLGGLAAKARDSKWVTNNQDSFIGRRAYNLSNSVANSTFDLRNTAVAGKMAGVGMGMGMGSKLGYDGETKAGMEARTKEALTKSARIKTHYERDMVKDMIGGDGKVVYEEIDDGKGGKVKRKVQEVVHRKGEIDADSSAAKDRLIAAAGGGTLFMTKKQKQDLRDTLGSKQNEETSKRIAENEANSTKDMQIYKSIIDDEVLHDGTVLTAKESKVRFLAGLENELKTLERTDPTLQGNQAQSLVKSINSIKKTEAAENSAFNKQVNFVLSNYRNKNERDKINYLGNQTEEVQKEIKNILETEKKEKGMVAEAIKDPLDLDLSPTESERRVSGINSASNLSGQVASVLANKPQNDAVQINSSEVDIPFDVSTQSFAEKVAATRAAKFKLAAQTADADMAMNTSRVTKPDPSTPIPSATVQAPTTPAANDPNYETPAWIDEAGSTVPAYQRKNGTNQAPTKPPEKV